MMVMWLCINVLCAVYVAIYKVADLLHVHCAYICTYKSCCLYLIAAFTVSLELQGDCSDQLTLICRHDDILSDPTWIHNGTLESGELLSTAFPGLTMYSFQNRAEHRVTVTGVENVAALDGYVFQCVYGIQGTLIKSNSVKYSFIPNGQSHVT